MASTRVESAKTTFSASFQLRVIKEALETVESFENMLQCS